MFQQFKKRTKILTCSEMARIERLAIEEKGQDLGKKFMEEVGLELARKICEHIVGKQSILLLCGKGNNGGDAYIAGSHLLKKGFQVSALQIGTLKECSSLCQKMAERFQKDGGQIHYRSDQLFEKADFIIDGLLGTGFKGLVNSSFAEIIKKANNSKKTILAIDIPSGLSIEALQEESEKIIKAEKTFYLGLAKTNFFFNGALNYCGSLDFVDFSLDCKYEEQAQSNYRLLQKTWIKSLLPKFEKTIHKYERGSCFIWAGSNNMMGAAFMATKACYRAGCGLVTLLNFGQKSIVEKIPELVLFPFENLDSVIKKTNLNKACLIGPGLGQSTETEKKLRTLMEQLETPTVLDADALNMYAHQHFKLPKSTIMTPHLGELARLLGVKKILKVTEKLIEQVKDYCKEKKVTLVVKGAPTFIVSPKEETAIYVGGSIGMAKGGSGDVLAGIIASLVSQGLSSYNASCLGVYLHGESGKIAAQIKTDFCLMPTDLIEYLPEVFKSLLLSGDRQFYR